MSTPPPRLFTADDRVFLHAAVRAGHANPFAPARHEAERAALGPLFVEPGEPGPHGAGAADRPPNLDRIATRLRPILDAARAQLVAGAAPDGEDAALYLEACLYHLRDALGERLQPIVEGREPPGEAASTYRAFREEHSRLLHVPDLPGGPPRPEHVFACASQLRRAHHRIASTLIGASRPAAELRATVWSAIFTRDIRGYLRTCDRKRFDVSTLVTGPSGTGKELVAQAIGHSRYQAVDPDHGGIAAAEGEDLCAVDLSALSDALFESELFGHGRGAFTGAVKDRKGVFESVRPGGALFLDEIGELTPDRQVTLLRVLETRTFHRVGDTGEHRISARVICATHRDMSERVRSGAFRLDLFQRLAGVRIVTPSLRQQLDAAPGDLALLLRAFARRVTTDDAAEALADEALRYIEEHLPCYPWPGNARELVHCVESIHCVGTFTPLDLGVDEDPARSLREGTLSEEEAIRRYRNIVYARTGSISETARQLGLHRNTVRLSLDRPRLARWRARRRR